MARVPRLAFLLFAAMSLTRPALACSFTPGYEDFTPGPALRPLAIPLQPPKVSVDSIRRGRAGDSGMCADLGFLVLNVPPMKAGYRFEIVEGSLPIVFPEGFVESVAPGFISFDWVDGNTDAQEPIRAVVRITAMSINGTLSEPSLLMIEDPGRVPAR